MHHEVDCVSQFRVGYGPEQVQELVEWHPSEVDGAVVCFKLTSSSDDELD